MQFLQRCCPRRTAWSPPQAAKRRFPAWLLAPSPQTMTQEECVAYGFRLAELGVLPLYLALPPLHRAALPNAWHHRLSPSMPHPAALLVALYRRYVTESHPILLECIQNLVTSFPQHATAMLQRSVIERCRLPYALSIHDFQAWSLLLQAGADMDAEIPRSMYHFERPITLRNLLRTLCLTLMVASLSASQSQG